MLRSGCFSFAWSESQLKQNQKKKKKGRERMIKLVHVVLDIKYYSTELFSKEQNLNFVETLYLFTIILNFILNKTKWKNLKNSRYKYGERKTTPPMIPNPQNPVVKHLLYILGKGSK